MRIYTVTVEGHGDCVSAEFIYYTEFAAMRCIAAMLDNGAAEVALSIQHVH